MKIFLLSLMILFLITPAKAVTINSICSEVDGIDKRTKQNKFEVALAKDLKIYLSMASNLSQKYLTTNQLSQEEEKKLISAAKKLLGSTPEGQKILTCFNDTSRPIHFTHFTNEYDLPDIKSISSIIIMFDNSLKKNIAGQYETVKHGATAGKVLRLNAAELKNPMTLLLVFAHEMQHGCYLDKREPLRQVADLSANWMDNPCSRFVMSNDPKNKGCKDFEAKVSPAFQDSLIDEMKSFKLMVDLFRDFAKAYPEVCKEQHSDKSKKQDPKNFWSGLRADTESHFWGDVEVEMGSNKFLLRVIAWYVEHANYEPEALYLNPKDSTHRLRPDLEKKLEAEGLLNVRSLISPPPAASRAQ